MDTLDSLQLNADIPGVILPTELPQTIIPDSRLFSTPGSFTIPLEVDPVPLEVDTNNLFTEELPQEMIPDPTTDSLIGDRIVNREAVASFQNTGTGLTAEYFDTLNLTNPIFTRTDATVDFDWGLSSPHPAIEADSFSIRWTGKIQPIYTETYTFHTLSNDGVRLWVNGELLIDQWVRQDTTEHNGTISLEAGQFYDIRLEYYDRNGNAVSQLSWSSDSQTKQIVPTSQLYSTLQFPEPLPGDSEVLELQLTADPFYNPGEAISIAGKVSGREAIAHLNRIDFSLQKDGEEWIDITDATEFTVNPDDPDSAFFNYQLSDLEPSHYQLTAAPLDRHGNSGEIISQRFTILSLEAGEQEQLSDRVLQAIASATNLDNYTPEQLAATREWVVSIKTSASSEQLASNFDAENLGETGYIPNTYFWEFPAEINPRDIVSRLGEEVNIEFAYPLVPLDIEFFSTPTNEPNFSTQWYLENAEIPQVWDNYQGDGVVVGVVDDGFDLTNPDLAANYLADLSFDFDQNDSDPSQALELKFLQEFLPQIEAGKTNKYRLKVSHVSGNLSNITATLDIKDVDIDDLDIYLISPEGTREKLSFTSIGNGKFAASTSAFNGENPNTHPIQRDYNWRLDIDNNSTTNGIFKNWLLTLETVNPHGTAVAGIVAASGDNQLLGTGVAPSANWAGLRLGADGFRGNEIASTLSHKNQEIDIYNNSWGQGFLSVLPPLGLWSFEDGVADGRDGLGSIYVFAAGNDRYLGDNVNYNGFANSRHTIAVAAIDSTGQQTFYSNPGAPLLVSAYANNVQTFFAPEESEQTNVEFNSKIKDGASLSSVLEVEDVEGEITGVQVNLDITHRHYEDLQVVLVSPLGTEVELFANVPFTERDRNQQDLSDLIGIDPSISLSSSAQKKLPEAGDNPALFLGTFQPRGDLNDFVGEDANGDWTLTVTDKSGNSNSSRNKLHRWSLNISTSGIVTTDIEGELGYTGEAKTLDFGGTSAATPLVSGVIALMLEANPNLSWREVQHLLVETADKNDPSDGDWTTNGAGYNINHKYGFGEINAQKAVELAEEWYNLGKTLGKEESIKSGPIIVWEGIPDYNEENPLQRVESTIELEDEDNLTVEWAEVYFQAGHERRGDLEVVLIHSYEDPETGNEITTESVLAESRYDPYDPEDNYSWSFTTARHWGEPSTGEWTLQVSDLWPNESGTFHHWELNLFGNKPNVEISATDSEASESGDLGEFAITLNEALTEDLTVYYAIEGTALNSADYVEGNGNGPLNDAVVIPAGTTEVMIPIEVVDDDEVEENETAILRLLEDGAYSIGEERIATINIADDDEIDVPNKLLAPDGASGDYFGDSVALNGNYALIGSYQDNDNGEDSGSAYLFDITSRDLLQKFIALDGAASDYFGDSVALNGNYALIGSWKDDDNGEDSGSVYLFDITSGEQLQKFIAPDGASGDSFGGSVALDGDHALISASGDDDNGSNSGSVYLFDITNGNLLQKFIAPDGASINNFGNSVALNGNYALIGSYFDDDNGISSGSAYLFDITNGDLLHKIIASDGATGDHFGSSVALDGNYALIGSFFDDDNGSNSGSAYLFDITSGEQLQKLIAPDGAINDWFGGSVALDENYALISSWKDDDNGSNSGSAYLFDITSGDLLQKIIAPDAASGDSFGNSVALDGDSVLIGSDNDEDNGNNSGSAYVFDISEFSQDEPTEPFPYSQKVLAPDATSGDEFGRALAINGNHILIASHWDDDKGTESGSAYLFDMTTGEQLQKFLAPDGFQYDEFGWSVAVDSNYALIGTFSDDDNGERSGSAYLFDITTGEQLQKFKAADGAPEDHFGWSVAIDGNYALVGSKWDEDNGSFSGSAYLFDITTGNQLYKFIAPDGESRDEFGWSVALEGDYALIGSYLDDDKGTDSGAAYLFNINSGEFVQKFVAPDGASDNWFGWSVALNDDSVLIGSYRDDDLGSFSGSAYLFDITTGDLQHKFLAPDGASWDWFGYSVALDADSALIGSPLDDDNGNESGSAYLFDITTSDLLQKFIATDGAEGDRFGSSVALDGDSVLIGSYFDDDNGDSSGSAYLFAKSEIVGEFVTPPPPNPDEDNESLEPYPLSPKITPADAASEDEFGYSVALNGTSALIGAYGDDDWGTNSGSAYLFDITNGDLLQKFLAPDGDSWDQFGRSAALDSDRALISAIGDDDNGENSGSVYLFNTASGEQLQKFIAADGASLESFGWSVALYGNYALIGSKWDEDNGSKSGSAYLFDTTTGELLHKFIAPDGASGDEFGYSVALNGNYALIGSYQDDDRGSNSGSAYLFNITTGDLLYKFKAADGASNDNFGFSVALDGNHALIGSLYDDDNGSYSGSAYLFNITSGEQLYKFLAEDGASGDAFGFSVSLDGDYAVIGATGDDDRGDNSGSTYLFDITTGTFVQKYLSPNGASGDSFGNAVAVSANSVLIGSYQDDVKGNDSGSAYLFAIE